MFGVILTLSLLSLAVSQDWDFAGVNIALNMNATQWPASQDNLTAQLAVDGRLGTCSQTDGSYQNEANWTVYFDRAHRLKGIRIHNREGYEYRLANFSVIAGLSVTDILYQDELAENALYNESQIDIPITSNVSFSEITIQIPPNTDVPDNSSSIINLCEVQIYSVTNDCSSSTLMSENMTWNVRDGTGFINTELELVSSGSVVEFECSSEFKLNGPSNVTCLSSGVFDDEPPTCILRCNLPTDIVNGEYQDPRAIYIVGDEISWNCSFGYTSEDNKTRQCMIDGTWSGQDPTCNIVTCFLPNNSTEGNMAFTNGSVHITEDVPYGTIVNVTCDEGFKPNVSTIVCGTNGQWDNIPGCLQVKCQSLGNITGGAYEYSLDGEVVPDEDPHVYRTVAALHCNEPLYRSSHGIIEIRNCVQDGYWNGSMSKCVPLCVLPELQNGSYNIGSRVANESFYIAGQSLIPECTRGYNLSNDVPRTCQPDHTWNGTDPVCLPITCTVPSAPANGRLQFDGSNIIEGKKVDVTESITVTCNEGFGPNTSNITCGYSGQWDGEAMCLQVRCDSLHPLDNGDYTYTPSADSNSQTVIYGTTARALCHKLFRLSANHTRVCGQDQSWSGEDIQCIPVCVRPTLDHGYFTSDDNTLEFYDRGQSVSPKCDLGFELDSGTVQSRMCQENHTWDGPEPQCNIITCSVGDFRTNENFYDMADKTVSSVEFNKTVTTHCLDGYERLGGDSMRTCLSNKSFSGEEFQCSEKESPSAVGAIVGGIAAAVVVIAATACLVYVCFFRRRKSKSTYDSLTIRVEYKRGAVDSHSYSMFVEPLNGKTNDSFTLEEPNAVTVRNTASTYHPRPTSVMDMNALVDFILNTDFRDKRFTDEFESFNKGLQKPHNAALSNPTQNRFNDILAYDETRVKLDVWDDENETDYINANYIVGYTDPRAYIACQGPLEETFNDFWRMVWQQESEIIIMLAKLVEDGKVQCGQYWPSEGNQTYGKITVALTTEEVFAHFVIRKFTINKEGEEVREVVQYHFTSWSENSCPNVCMRVLNFCNKANDKDRIIQGPMVVHCSNGAGRTGTFIAIDYLSEQSMEEGTAVVSDCVRHMRDMRPDMVQTTEQYVYIHQALVESFLLNTFDVVSDDFAEVYTAMLANDPLRGKPKIDVDFDNLQRIATTAPTAGTQKPDKNRNQSSSPSTEYMPSIEKHGLTNGGEDYINATFLPTYKHQDGMIITQSPLENTREDFWKVVYHQKVTTIVMMNDTSTISEKEVYWPQTDETITFGELAVTHKGVGERSGHTVLSLTLKRNDEEREVTLIQFGTWKPGSLVPAERKDILTALKLVEEKQTADTWTPVLVHCMDGAEMSGLFCVISMVLERENVEQSITVPHVIQEMRSRREHIIPNIEQFRFCYEVVLEYLKKKKTSSFK